MKAEKKKLSLFLQLRSPIDFNEITRVADEKKNHAHEQRTQIKPYSDSVKT